MALAIIIVIALHFYLLNSSRYSSEQRFVEFYLPSNRIDAAFYVLLIPKTLR